MPRNFNRFVLLLGAAFLATAPALHAQQTGAPVRGDVDGDGRVTAADARIVSDYLVGKPVPAGANVRERGDVNGDGRVTAVDAAIIARAAAGRDVSRFPVGKPAPEGTLGVLECDANIGARTLSCSAPGAPNAPGGARANVVYSGQNGVYVKLTTPPEDIVVDSAQHTYSFTATVQNLLAQAVGVDTFGVADGTGVRVFFDPLPWVDIPAGSGLHMHVNNPSGTDGTFLDTNQTYYQYSGAELGGDNILSPGEISASKTWVLGWEDGAIHFKFRLYISTEMQFPEGWIDIYPTPPPARQDSSPTFIPTKTLHRGETAVLTGTVRNHLGNPLGTPVQQWQITTHNAASIGAPTSDSTIVVTADSIGTDTITAKTGKRTGRIAIVVVPGAAANMVKSAGDGQSATVGTAVATPPAVTITDSNGDPVPGVMVHFTVTGGGGSVIPDSVATNSSGVAALTSWTLGTTAGANTLDASSTGLTTVTFTATGTAGAPTNMVKSAGDGQTAAAGTAVAIAPAVTITDTHGNPVSGVSVTFAVASGGTGSGVTGSPATTNASGVATVGSWTLGNTAGANTLDASSTGLTTVTFTATGVAGPPANMVKSAGDGQTATAGTAVAVAPAVTITDAHGNPVSGVGVTFAVASGGTGSGVTGGSATTNASGVATVGSWTLGNTAGANTLDASSTGLTTVTFTATGVAGPPALIEKVAPLATDTVNPGSAVPTPPQVRVKDTHGNLVSGASVTFTPSAGSSVTGGSQTTNASGEATVGSWTINTDGAKTLTVHVTPGTAVDSVFNAYGNMAPTAVRDSMDAIGNVQVTATGLKGNDTDPEGRPLNITPGTFTTAGNGSVTLTAAGDVTYNSLVGFTGVDSVTYTLNDHLGRTATGKLIIRVPDRFWFVQGGGSGNGTMASPSGNFTFGAALAAKDSIFLLSTATVASGVTLPNGGALIGRGIGSNITRTLGGGANMTVNPVTLLTTGSAPTLTVSSGTGVTLTSAGTGYIVKGLALVTSAGAGISGSNFGTLALSTNELSINATGGAALNLTTGTLSATLSGVTASGGTNNVALSGVTLSGAVGLGGGALSGASGTALSLTNVTSATATDSLFYSGSVGNSTASASVGVSGGSLRLSLSGNISQAGAGAVVSVSGGHTGTLNFNTGTVSASTGTGLQFDNADGTYAFNNGVTFSGGDAGIDVLNGSGGTFTFPASSQITGPTNEAIRINASAPTFTYLGRIDKTNGSTGISVTSNTGGTISFGSRLKKITSTGASVAVNLTSNGTATITSLDSLQIISATGNGYNATGGGTVEVQGTNNTIQSSGGIALNVSSTTIGANGLKFKSITAAGGSNGIVLSSTGSNGGLTVTGDGSTNGSGGSITNTTGADGATGGNGVYLSSARKISLSWMAFSGHANNGIFGTGVRGGFTLNHVRFTGTNGNSSSGTFDESPVHLVDAGGPIKMTNSRFDGGAYNAVLVENISGTAPAIDSLVIDTDTVTSMQGSTSDVRSTALLVNLLDGTADIRIRNNFVTAWWGNGIHVLSQGAASATARITNNTVDNQNGALAGAGGIWVGGGNLAYNISNNVVKHTNGTAISAGRSNNPAGANMNGTIDSNAIGVSGDVNSGSATGIAIFAEHHGLGVSTVKISNNTIRQIAGSASGAITTNLGDDSGSGGSGTFNATVTGNNIAETGSPTNNAQQGMFFEAGAASGDNDAMCLDVGGATAALKNTITNFNTTAPAANQNRIRVNQRFLTTVKLPGYTGAGGDNTAVQTYILGRNTISNALAQNTSATYSNTSPAGSACPQPTM